MQQDFENIANNFISELKCIASNPGSIICCEKECVHPGIMCNIQTCKCQLLHQKCESQVKVKKIIRKLASAKQDIPKDLINIFQIVLNSIDAMIEQLSLLRQQIKNNQQYYGLSKSEIQFYSHLLSSQFQNLNGKLVAAIKQQVKQVKQKLCWLSSQTCAQLIQNQRKKLGEICKGLSLLFQPNMRPNSQSKIIDDFKLLQQWIVVQTKTPIKQFKLLYRGSQNAFSASRFHQKCDDKTNTLVLVKTNFGKVIGGFTLCKWNQVQFNYAYDFTQKTFVFSLTDKQKANQIIFNGHYSIYCHPDYGPTFGGGFDLFICDKSNIEEGSYGKVGYSFFNGNYPYGDKNSYPLWTGNANGHNFKTQQYEVFQVLLVGQ